MRRLQHRRLKQQALQHRQLPQLQLQHCSLYHQIRERTMKRVRASRARTGVETQGRGGAGAKQRKRVLSKGWGGYQHGHTSVYAVVRAAGGLQTRRSGAPAVPAACGKHPAATSEHSGGYIKPPLAPGVCSVYFTLLEVAFIQPPPGNPHLGLDVGFGATYIK
jgi:hypothetical protein